MKENQYISYGGGVNSTTFLVLEETKYDEAVFVNHGGDYPYTYNYIDYLEKKGFNITTIIPEVTRKGITYNDLYDYCTGNKILPFRTRRWCTGEFKVTPVRKYVEKPSIISIGFDFGEVRRMNNMLKKKYHGITYKFPLIKNRFSRQDCKDIIRDAGLKVPEKSGCYFCPFQSKRELKKLYNDYPELYIKTKFLEENVEGSKPTYLRYEKPLDTIVGADTHKLEDWSE